MRCISGQSTSEQHAMSCRKNWSRWSLGMLIFLMRLRPWTPKMNQSEQLWVLSSTDEVKDAQVVQTGLISVVAAPPTSWVGTQCSHMWWALVASCGDAVQCSSSWGTLWRCYSSPSRITAESFLIPWVAENDREMLWTRSFGQSFTSKEIMQWSSTDHEAVFEAFDVLKRSPF